MMNVPHTIWYGGLIISEFVLLPCRVGYDIIERANRTYNKYKNTRTSSGYTN